MNTDQADHGKTPYVVNIEALTNANTTFRTAVWTGTYLQTTVMSIEAGGNIGLEVHDDHDQFLRVESGSGKAMMGPSEDDLTFNQAIGDDDAVFVPAGMWHDIVNTGDEPLKLYSIYAPSEHPFGTVHQTKADADAAEAEHHA